MYLAVDGTLVGLLAVSDPIKQSTPEAVQALKAAGIRVIMATGDGISTAKAVAEQLGIDEVHGEVKPADKLNLVDKLQSEGCIVAMAGDGINDAPGTGQGECRYRYGNRDGRSDEQCANHLGKRRPAGYLDCPGPVKQDCSQYEAEPWFCVHL